MGHEPIPPAPRRRPPDRESFHLAVAKGAYASGHLSVDELEASVEHVLAGGHLDALGRPHATPPAPAKPADPTHSLR